MTSSPNGIMSCGMAAVVGYKCCPGAKYTDSPGTCGAILKSKCVCDGIGHDIDPACSTGENGSPCCRNSDCAWKDSATHTGYCNDHNTCVVWEKWPEGHGCTQDSDCASNICGCPKFDKASSSFVPMSGTCRKPGEIETECAANEGCWMMRKTPNQCASGMPCESRGGYDPNAIGPDGVCFGG